MMERSPTETRRQFIKDGVNALSALCVRKGDASAFAFKGGGVMVREMRTMCKTILAAVVAAMVLVGMAAERLPSLEASYFGGKSGRIDELAKVAGPDWREVAEKNRTTGLEKLSWGPLTTALIEKMQKYADKETGDVGGEPIDEVGEIAEASFRASDFCFTYGLALWRHFFEKGKPVRDKVTAAKLLNGFERGVAGVVPMDATGEKVGFAPRWMLTHCQYGRYKTALPGGGSFEQSWSNNNKRISFDIKTTAKTLDCHVTPAAFMGFYYVLVNGKHINFGHSAKGCDFVVNIDGGNPVHIELQHSMGWPERK